MTTKKDPQETTKATGEKALSAIDSFVGIVHGHTGPAKSIKGHVVWMPASLRRPENSTLYVPFNINGFQIGENELLKITKDWLINPDDLNLEGLIIEPDGFINLLDTGYPWETEGLKATYISRLIKVLNVPDNVVKAARPVPKQQFHFG